MRKFWLPLVIVLAFSGCGKKTETTTSGATQTGNAATPLEGKVDQQLTAALKQFVAEKGRLPASILELTGAKTDSLPRPPEGFTYAIDAATTEVKLVKR
jgi:hypothetical protein